MKMPIRIVFAFFLLTVIACRPVDAPPNVDIEEENLSESEVESESDNIEDGDPLGSNYDLEVKDATEDVEICSGNAATQDPIADLIGFNVTNLDGFITVNVNLVQGIESDPPLDIFVEFANDAVPTTEPGGGRRTILVHFFAVVFSGGWLDAFTGETDNTDMTISWHRQTGVLTINFPSEYLGKGEVSVIVSSIHRLNDNTCDSTETGSIVLE